MVQEVQTQWNWYQTPNRIEWIWHSERRLSDHTQVRDKKTNMVVFQTSIGVKKSLWERFATHWTYDASDGIVYKVIWWDIYMSQPGAYMVKYLPYQWYVGSSNLTVKLYVDSNVAYELTAQLKDHLERTFVLNLWLKNKIRVSWYLDDEVDAGPQLTFTFVKL